MQIPVPFQIVQVMSDEEILEKLDPALRLPRQAEHDGQIVGHFLAGKNSKEIVVAIPAHFQRLSKYHRQLLGLAQEIEGDSQSWRQRATGKGRLCRKTVAAARGYGLAFLCHPAYTPLH
ncbi:MAG: hypothetical protein LW703_13345 [Rhodobacter sp.]|nr:hypothetical protein [Rhodobacter sp.]